MTRNEFETYIFEKFKTKAEHPWGKYPNYAVFRHKENRKWFAVTMSVPVIKFGIFENRNVNVVNLKITEESLDISWQEEGIFPAYHMNKDHWISVFLDGSVPDEIVKKLLEISFEATL